MDTVGPKCSICQINKEKSEYSSKQLKAKGKRKCNECVQMNASVAQLSSQLKTHQKEQKSGKKSQFLRDFQSEGSTEVKKVLANDVNSKQMKNMKNLQATLPGQDKYDVLLQWLKAGGAHFPKLTLRYYTVDYRGVHAKQRMDADECILSVPLKLLMTSEVAKESKIGKRIESSGCQLRSAHSWLACFLLQEKYNPESFWKPYIDTLPKHYRNMPIFFDDEEMAELKGSLAFQMTQDRKMSLKMEYDNIVKFVPEFSEYHHLDFFWARLAVITRIFGFEVGALKTDGLVAMADMLNHKRPNETSWTYDQAKGAFTITTTKKLLKGAQVFDSYGRKCNSRYFVNYGFALDQNEDNQTALFFSLPRPAPDATDLEVQIYKTKAGLIGAGQRRFQIPFEHKEKVTKKCVSYLRIANATLPQLAQIKQEAKRGLEIIDPVSPELEYIVIQQLAESCQRCLDGFATTLEEDNKMLDDPNSGLTMNVRGCVIMRRGEKEVCHAWIRLAAIMKQLNDEDKLFDARQVSKYCAQKINNTGKKPDFNWRMEKYFEEFWIPVLETGKVMPDLEEMNNSLGE